MFAVMKTGGKQYRVAPGDQLKVERLPGEAGDIVEFGEVLMIGDKIGAPFVDGAMVAAEIIEQGRARKVIIFKKRRRQNSRRKNGHRQLYSLVEVTELLTDGKKPSKKAAAKKPAKKDEKEAAPEKKAAPAKSDTKAEAKTEDKKAKAAPKDDGKAADSAAAAPLFKAPKGEPDDLTQIKGIGPVAKDQGPQPRTAFCNLRARQSVWAGPETEIPPADPASATSFAKPPLPDWCAGFPVA